MIPTHTHTHVSHVPSWDVHWGLNGFDSFGYLGALRKAFYVNKTGKSPREIPNYNPTTWL